MDKKLKKSVLKNSKKATDKNSVFNIGKKIDSFNMIRKNDSAMKFLNSIIPFAFIINIIVILYVGSIIFYLHKIKNCPCFIEKNKNNYTNINYLLIIEYIILSLNVFMSLSLLIFIFNYNSTSSLTKKGGAIQNYPTPLIIFFCLLFAVYSFFVYYVYKLHENISEDCECSQSWIRYLLYIQSIMIVISLSSNAYMIIYK